MKKNIIICCILIFNLTSCKKSYDNRLIGTWQLEKVTYSLPDRTQVQESDSNDLFIRATLLENGEVNLKQTIRSEKKEITGRWSIKHDTLLDISLVGIFSKKFKYQVDNDTAYFYMPLKRQGTEIPTKLKFVKSSF